MAFKSLLLLACFSSANGRRIQTPLEHAEHEVASESAFETQSYGKEDGNSIGTQFPAHATHLFAQPLPHVLAPAATRSSPVAVSHEARPRVQTASMTDTLAPEGLKEESIKPPESDKTSSSPNILTYINYLLLGFVGAIKSLRPKGNALERLNKVSNFASILCAIDCTVFPIMLTVLPLVSAVSTAGAQAWLHEASHACALWFVGPVGGTAVLTNWMQHKKPWVGLWGLTGVATILLANIHLPHVILGMNIHAFGHMLHDWHEPINVMGCILLLSSQRYAHSLVSCGDCGHSHGACGHSHGKDDAKDSIKNISENHSHEHGDGHSHGHDHDH
jgi:hypothetical protein